MFELGMGLQIYSEHININNTSIPKSPLIFHSFSCEYLHILHATQNLVTSAFENIQNITISPSLSPIVSYFRTSLSESSQKT